MGQDKTNKERNDFVILYMLCLIVAERSVILDFRKSVVGIKSYKNNLFFYLVIMHILRKNL